ncbi:bifunctional methylenetetrahydrofolate dehydrogenase/methenyltetrahydrofolate cyclohydrolase FolD [Mangrovicella endophytica]|uniref:bifunctional methylenetetrahydrofolate dehydrogenase/methenyltetrahydrofolate cyclohydrolase FolD n=1 Tax=Mangrovicella endophytica TaxID=2066697 RepID=UPI000C9DC392|nr:bifunctional methylenetetrahydrofolate dehydrogenase/methenyltetrahydrofolate cyclohydrolase FolD [Mangrovicella endophytica]
MSEGKRIDGKAAAARIVDTVRQAVPALTNETGAPPGLAVVIVGEDPASQVYVASKAKMALECGFKSVKHVLPADTAEDDLLDLVRDLNADGSIHGILVQLPLPKQINATEVLREIDPSKDVDGFSPINAGLLATGSPEEAFVPCTPAGAMILLRDALGEDLSGRTAVVVGRSNIVGKPMAQLLLVANATVIVAHSRTKDLAALCRTADIVIAAVGRPEMIRGTDIKEGAVVIDVGINRIDAPERGEGKTRLVGDVAYDEAIERASAITPVPGGVGPMTIAMLMANTLTAAYRSAGLQPPRF